MRFSFWSSTHDKNLRVILVFLYFGFYGYTKLLDRNDDAEKIGNEQNGQKI